MIMLRVLVLSLLLPPASARAEDARPSAAAVRDPEPSLTELTAAAFAVRGGGFGELGLCSPRRPRTVSGYSCLSFDLGKQDGRWIATEVAEWGLSVQPTPRLTIKGGVGFSLLTLLVDGLACVGKSSGSAGADGPSGDASGGRKSCGIWLPMQFYPGASASLTIPAPMIDVVLTASTRYIVPIPGSVDVVAPSGLAVSLGAGVAF